MRLIAVLSLLLVACSRPEPVAKASATTESPSADFFSCRYRNPFSHVDECKEYRGRAFDEAEAQRACARPFASVVGSLSRVPCGAKGAIGTCIEKAGTDRMIVSYAYGGFATLYEGACEGFAHGVWREDASVPAAKPPSTLLDEARVALRSDTEVEVVPACLDEACVPRLVTERRALWFRPRGAPATEALVVYPGAAVDPRAYAPVAHELARAGVAVAVVPMPGMLALAGVDRARDVMARAPEISDWFLAGHSLGGAMAARFVREHRDARVRGLVLWAAFPDVADDLHETTMPVASIFGSEDGRTTPEEVASARSLLPATTRYVRLEGANHAQFGSYGVQEGDGVARIERAMQRAQIVDATLSFVRSVRSMDGSRVDDARRVDARDVLVP